MPFYVSASSRLHALLTAVLAQPGQPLRSCWSKVLNVPPADVQFAPSGLPLVAHLIAEARDEAKRAEANVGLPYRDSLVGEWLKPVYMPGGNLDQALQQHLVSQEAVNYLSSIANVLGKTESQSELPEDDELADLLDELGELSDSVEQSQELADDVRQAILRRIAQVRFAIENSRLGGPEGVEEAIELLLGAIILRSARVPRATAKRVFAVVAATYMVFSAGPAVQASLGAWPNVIRTLTSDTHAGSSDTRTTETLETQPQTSSDTR